MSPGPQILAAADARMGWRNRVEVSYGALRENVAAILAAAQGRKVIAVVKADAYGLGLERCARIYHQAGVDAFAVAAALEADRIRRIVPSARIILLSSPLPEERSTVVTSAYEVSCSTMEEVREFARLANRGSPQAIHSNVDTGMGRFGALPQEAARIIDYVLESDRLRLAGISTHYPMAVDPVLASEQERVFEELLSDVGVLPHDCWIHYANSEGLLVRPRGRSNAVRVGLLLTGVIPDNCAAIGVRPAVNWVSSMTLVKRLPKGHGISYNRAHVLERDSVIGVVPVGYADGLPLALSGKGQVLVQGRRCPILGRITMDYCMVDLTDLGHMPAPGEPVVLFGSQGDDCITINEVARWAGTIAYDILCGLRGRCEVVGIP
jgi:alanine racemase